MRIRRGSRRHTSPWGQRFQGAAGVRRRAHNGRFCLQSSSIARELTEVELRFLSDLKHSGRFVFEFVVSIRPTHSLLECDLLLFKMCGIDLMLD